MDTETDSTVIVIKDLVPEHDTLTFDDLYLTSNSPIGSNYGSDAEDNHRTQLECAATPTTTTKKTAYPKLSLMQTEELLSKYYTSELRYCNEQDVLFTYLRGMQAVHQFSHKLLKTAHVAGIGTTTAILITLAVVAPFSLENEAAWISAGNVFATLLLLHITYQRADVNSFHHWNLATSYQRIERDFAVVNEYTASSPEHMDNLQERMRQEPFGQVVFPEETTRVFPVLHTTNIFHAFQKINHYQKQLICQLCDVKNEIASIRSKHGTANGTKPSRESNRLLFLMKHKEVLKSGLIAHKETYNQFNDLLLSEIQYYEKHKFFFAWGGWFKPNYDVDKLNPILRDLLRLTLKD